MPSSSVCRGWRGGWSRRAGSRVATAAFDGIGRCSTSTRTSAPASRAASACRCAHTPSTGSSARGSYSATIATRTGGSASLERQAGAQRAGQAVGVGAQAAAERALGVVAQRGHGGRVELTSAPSAAGQSRPLGGHVVAYAGGDEARGERLAQPVDVVQRAELVERSPQ